MAGFLGPFLIVALDSFVPFMASMISLAAIMFLSQLSLGGSMFFHYSSVHLH